MIALFNFSDLLSGGSLFGMLIGAIFFLLISAAAFVAYKALSKTAKFALRSAIVAIILMIALVGGVSLWYFSAFSAPPKDWAPTRSPSKNRAK